MSRITLEDTGMSAIIKMAEGSPGAVAAMTNMMNCAEEVDPQSALGPLGPVMMLDTFEIYGSSIYVLWNDTCGRSAHKVLLLIRAVQCGIMPVFNLQALAIDGLPIRKEEPDFEKLFAEVKEQITDFKPLTEEANHE